VGARGGWMIDHRITTGIAGHGLATGLPNKAYDQLLIAVGDTLLAPSQFRTGYGGLLIEPILAHRSAIHVGLPIIIDAGGRGYQTFKPYQNDLTSFDHIGDFPSLLRNGTWFGTGTEPDQVDTSRRRCLLSVHHRYQLAGCPHECPTWFQRWPFLEDRQVLKPFGHRKRSKMCAAIFPASGMQHSQDDPNGSFVA